MSNPKSIRNNDFGVLDCTIAKRQDFAAGSMSVDIPTYAAPPAGKLTSEMMADYREAGVLILRDFVSRDACDRLRQRMLEMVNDFDPSEVRTVFSTTSDTHQADDYFVSSGDKIRFFLENGAFDADGKLRQSKADSLNKVGHAMHDLDPVFDRFSRTPALAAVVERLGIANPGIHVYGLEADVRATENELDTDQYKESKPFIKF